MPRLIVSLSVLVALLIVQNAQATITQTKQSASPSTVQLTATGSSLVRWTVTANIAVPTTASVSSSVGEFRGEDLSLLGTVNTTVQQTIVTTVPNQFINFNLAENLIIPQSIVRRAQLQGFSRIYYIRTFTDQPDLTSVQASVVFSIRSSDSMQGLSISRVEMRFDDQKVSAFVQQNETLHAQALINYNGSGMLEYSWEVASPPSTSGQYIWIPLSIQKQYLAAGGQIMLSSPPLRTNTIGQYLVRLNLKSPAAVFRLPVLKYSVQNDTNGVHHSLIQTMQVAAPADDAVLLPETLFRWEPVTGAVAYQVEIYNRPVRESEIPGKQADPLVTGILVPVDKTQLTIGQISRRHLQSGKTYYWRVVGLSKKGTVISRSDFRKINFQ